MSKRGRILVNIEIVHEFVHQMVVDFKSAALVDTDLDCLVKLETEDVRRGRRFFLLFWV